MKKTLIALLVVDVVLAIAIYLWKGQIWLINSQVAYLSSSLIMLASMKSYQKMVAKAVEAGAVTDDGRDALAKLEDPYDLYEENLEQHGEEKTIQEVIKEERANLKRNRRSIWETTKDAKASFSLYRLTAYAFLVLGFFYLNGNHILELIPYLTFLAMPLLVVVFSLLDNLDKKA
jgi:hypothetical protein